MKKTLLILLFTFIGIATMNSATAQTYDPYAVQVINYLIANNGLNATPDAPTTWEFATWNSQTPKKILKLDFESKNLTGNVSFAGLATLEKLYCSYKSLSKLDVSNCTTLIEFYCWDANLTELNVLDCKQLKVLVCGYNKLSELDVSNCTLLKDLGCQYNEISELDVSHCKQLKSLWCQENRLAKLDLTGLNYLNDFYGIDQKPFITFYKNDVEEYTCNISLNNPTFGHSALSYSDGILKSSNVGVKSTSFQVQTGKAGCKLTGTMFFDYDGVGLEIYNSYELQVINSLIANNGLNATPNAPETWTFATWNYELPKQITKLNFYGMYYPIPLSGDVSFADFTALTNFACNGNSLTKLYLSNCVVLQNLSCMGNNLTELDVTNCTQLKYLACADNNLTKLIVTNCTALQDMFCYNNRLTELNLTGINNLNNFYGDNQKPFVTLYKNETEEYSCNILLNKPTLGNNAISYSGGILKSTNIAATKSSFEVHTNKEGCKLTGTMFLEYDGIGLEIYDPHDLQVINNLIANNGLGASPNQPLIWDFATWNDELPKQITELYFPSFVTGWPYMVWGDVQLAGLTALKKLTCYYSPKKSQLSNPKEGETIQDRTITKLNLENCTSLQTLNCWMNEKLSEIILTKCSQLHSLDFCSCNLTKIDLSDCTQLKELECIGNRLIDLDVSKCSLLEKLWCYDNHLTKLDLTGLNNLKSYYGSWQNVSLTLVKNEANEYTHSILLNNPTFGNDEISYWDNILKSIDNTVASTSFTVQTGKQGFELSGTMSFTYSDVGVKTQEKIGLKVYPNPVSDILFIESENFNTIKLYDMLGRKILAQSVNDKTEINISHLPNGIYIVAVFSEGKLMGNSKIIKQ